MTQDSPGTDDPERTRSMPDQLDGPTRALDPDTSRTIGMWSLDELLQETPRPVPLPAAPRRRASRRPAYYVTLTVAVMLVLGLVAALAVLSVKPPVSRVAGTPTGVPIPELPAPTESTPPKPPPAPPAGDPLTGLAEHPLSTSTTATAPLTCALPRFDPADNAQATFYDAAKVCADGVFGGIAQGAGLPAAPVRVLTVQGGPADSPCGAVEPTAPATQCRGTVYMTPSRLRDVEGLDRFPGKYFGVFLREYAEAVLEGTGVTKLYDSARKKPDAAEDLADRLARQATCLAGIVSSAMAGLGAVDANITGEIRDRLTSVDAPPDAGSWLDKGFRSRQPASCNTWVS